MHHLLIIHGGHEGGRTYQLVEAVRRGVLAADEAIELRTLPALQAGIDDLLWANGLLIGTPEHFGYMAGAIKDFMDRTFYPAEGKVDGLPYAVFVSAGNDGTGAVNAIERIALGYKWIQMEKGRGAAHRQRRDHRRRFTALRRARTNAGRRTRAGNLLMHQARMHCVADI